MSKTQILNESEIKILLITKKLRQIDLIPILKKQFPKLDVQKSHISKALAGKYPSFLLKINEVINEI